MAIIDARVRVARDGAFVAALRARLDSSTPAE
jgi:hypothetical protein